MALFLRERAAMAGHQNVSQQGNRIERLIGWSLAIWIHPVAAWQLRSRRARTVLVVGYFAASYLGVSAALHFFGPLAAV